MTKTLETLLAETKAICETYETTLKGPWCGGGNDAAFIAHARTALPRLVAALELAVEQLDAAVRDANQQSSTSDLSERDIRELEAELARVLSGGEET